MQLYKENQTPLIQLINLRLLLNLVQTARKNVVHARNTLIRDITISLTATISIRLFDQPIGPKILKLLNDLIRPAKASYSKRPTIVQRRNIAQIRIRTQKLL